MSYQSTELADAPIRYYRLGESSGTTVHDLGSQAQNGTINGGVTPGQPGLIAGDSDTAMLFVPASSGYISLPTTGLPTGASAWSMECWVKMPNPLPAGFPAIMNMGTPNTNEFVEVFFRGSSMTFEIDDWTSTVLQQIGNPVAGGIYHLVVTYDGTTCQFYINGNLNNSVAKTFNLAAGAAQIGNDQTGSFWSGVIDEAAFYATCLTPTQVATHYNAGIQTPHFTAVTWTTRDLQQVWKTRG